MMLPKCPLLAMSSPMPVFPKPAGVDSGRATTEPTVSKQHRRPTSLPRVVSVLSEWKNAAENASEKTRQRRHCARKFGSFPRGLSTPAENKIRRRRLRGSRPHWFAMIGFSSARHADSDCARVASSPSYFLPRWSPPRQSGEIPPRQYPRRLVQGGAARGSFAYLVGRASIGSALETLQKHVYAMPEWHRLSPPGWV